MSSWQEILRNHSVFKGISLKRNTLLPPVKNLIAFSPNVLVVASKTIQIIDFKNPTKSFVLRIKDVEIDFPVIQLQFDSTYRFLGIMGHSKMVICDFESTSFPKCFEQSFYYSRLVRKEVDRVYHGVYVGLDLSSYCVEFKWFSEGVFLILKQDSTLLMFDVFSSLNPIKTHYFNDGDFVSMSIGRSKHCWSEFTVYAATKTGKVYCICPVCPPKITISKEKWLQMLLEPDQTLQYLLRETKVKERNMEVALCFPLLRIPLAPQELRAEEPYTMNMNICELCSIDNYLFCSFDSGMIDVYVHEEVYPKFGTFCDEIKMYAKHIIDLECPSFVSLYNDFHPRNKIYAIYSNGITQITVDKQIHVDSVFKFPKSNIVGCQVVCNPLFGSNLLVLGNNFSVIELYLEQIKMEKLQDLKEETSNLDDFLQINELQPPNQVQLCPPKSIKYLQMLHGMHYSIVSYSAKLCQFGMKLKHLIRKQISEMEELETHISKQNTNKFELYFKTQISKFLELNNLQQNLDKKLSNQLNQKPDLNYLLEFREELNLLRNKAESIFLEKPLLLDSIIFNKMSQMDQNSIIRILKHQQEQITQLKSLLQ